MLLNMRKLVVFVLITILTSPSFALEPTPEQKKDFEQYTNTLGEERDATRDRAEKFSIYMKEAFRRGEISEPVYSTIQNKINTDEQLSHEQYLRNMQRESKYNPWAEMQIEFSDK